MNLVEQLKQTPKWKLFEEWYKESIYAYGGIHFEGWYCGGEPQSGFVDLSFHLQKGVFEKFIESEGDVFEQTCDRLFNNLYSIWQLESGYKKSKSFDSLLIWYFNN